MVAIGFAATSFEVSNVCFTTFYMPHFAHTFQQILTYLMLKQQVHYIITLNYIRIADNTEIQSIMEKAFIYTV